MLLDHCFEHLTVEENLLTGAYTRSNNKEVKEDLERVYNYFPRLRDRRTSLAGYTSGGEQQMIAIGRALMAHPTMILLDEPSMGLAPQLVKQIFEIVAEINRKEFLHTINTLLNIKTLPNDVKDKGLYLCQFWAKFFNSNKDQFPNFAGYYN